MTLYKNFLFTATLVLLFVSAASAQATVTARQDAAFKKIDFLNYTYDSRLCADNFGMPSRVKISDGEIETSEYYFRVDDKTILYGDVTGDTRTDAIVPVQCSASAGNFVSTEIYVFTAQAGKAKLLATINNTSLERDYKRYFPKGFVVRVAPKGVTVENGKINIDVYADGSNAGPKYLATMVYVMKSTKPTIVGKPKRRPSGI